ncbi:MAG TPA: DNA repair protein RecN [Burkholderiales bacterium]|nr:DNA repair protein RecN [Burkholderiales bacterium]
MLRSLSIRDFVIVDRLDLEFQDGFTVLTGETGAGKSILVDALALVLGSRSDAGQVREGAARAEICAEFALDALPQAQAWLQTNDLADEPGLCLLRRVLEAGGRSRAYVNGRPATLQQLEELAEMLVDIHGQHEHQSLLRPAAQRELLDAYAGASALARDVAGAWREWQEVRRQRLEWEKNADALAAERERLQWQRQELERLAFAADEWGELQLDHKRLAHAASLVEAVESALEALSEGEAAALAAVNAAVSRLNAAAEYDPGLKETLDVLEPAQIQLQEAVYGLRHYRNRIDLDPRRLQEVEQRLEALHTTARKYRVAPPQLPELLADAARRLEEIGAGASPEALAKREREAQARYRTVAEKLGAERARTAQELGRRVTEQMQGLAMAGGRFEAVLKPLAEGSAHGMEQIEFLVAANPGATARSLAKVASGGELSRISLAIQTVTSTVAPVPTLVFDEVDAGIGGRVAEIVGRMLAALGSKHQVMCITHLPQVAAAAHHQWQVSKTAAGNGVRSEVRELDRAQRVEEIARMLGGVKITETTRKHAAEMLGERRDRKA